jgi:hypothetical protein
MKKSLLLVGICCVLMVGFWSVSAGAPANFSGTWALDKAKSEGLQGRMANLDQTWAVMQDAKMFTVEVSFSGGEQPMPAQKRSYNLDGTETTMDVAGRMPGKATMKAKWQGDGKILELNSVTKANFQGNDITITTTEHWELADGGKTLKVHRVSENPRGTQETKLVFEKK